MAQDTVDASNDPLEDLYNSIRTARFVEKVEDGFVFDVGQEQQAMVEAEEYPAGEEPSVGDEVRLLVERPYGQYWAASRRKAEKLAIWDRLAALADSGEPVQGLIVAENKGGLSVDMGPPGEKAMSVRAFVPRSQVDVHRVDDFTPYVGRSERFRVIDFDTDRGNVVLSRRVLLEEELEASRGDLVASLEPGQVFDGVVRNVVDFGAFIDIGGIEGLLHASNMSWGRIDHPSELLRPGDELQVVVLDWKPERKRLSLGRKQLLADPWENIGERYSEGDVVTGKVVSLADFGAFVELEPGLDGLVHVTELSWTERINHPRDVLALGAEVRVKIIGIDPDNRRMSLSIKQLEQNPWEQVAETLTPGSRITGPIVNVTDFGLFVEIVPGIDGLVHVSDLSWTEKIDDPAQHYKVGQEVEVVVLDVDPETTRASLGIKQLEADPWQEAKEKAVPGKKIEVTISRLVDFGAFAEILPGVEGLIHISELAEDRVERVADVVRPGQQVEALVTSFDRANERIGLSLKRDRLGEENESRSYTDEAGGATLGDIFRDRLGLAAPAPVPATEESTASHDAAKLPAEEPPAAEEAPAAEEPSAADEAPADTSQEDEEKA